MENHGRSHDAKWTLKTVLKKETRSRPAFTHESIYRICWKLNPNAVTDLPLFLQQSTEWAILKPEQLELCVVLQVVLYTANTSEILIVEPVNICVSKLCIARTAINFSSVHIPQV